MQQHYGAKWKTQSKLKLREMSDADARYILIHDRTPTHTHTAVTQTAATHTGRGEQQPASSEAARERVRDKGDGEGARKVLAGAVQVRFVEEEKLPVLYVYELQLQRGFQGKGVGRFVMQLIELVARKVQKSYGNRTGTVRKPYGNRTGMLWGRHTDTFQMSHTTKKRKKKKK